MAEAKTGAYITSEKKEAVLDRIQVLSRAGKESRRAILKAGKLQKGKKGGVIFQERAPVDSFYFVAEGFVVLYRTTHSQDRKAIFVCRAGEMLNEPAVEETEASVSARILSSEAMIFCIRRGIFLEIMRSDPALYDAVFSSLVKKLRRTYHQLGNVSGSIHLDRQVAAKLYKLGRDFGIPDQGRGGLRMGFPLSIAFLAELVGSKRETVSRVVKSLAAAGLVSADKDGFRIADLDRLRKYVYARQEESNK